METLSASVREIEKHLSDQLGRREKVLKESRDVISASSRAIVSVHNHRMADAKKQIEEARVMLVSLKKASEGPASRYLVSPETELVEASAVYALANGKDIPKRAALDASPEAYILGLLDTVGELKRLVLDSMMKGKITLARKYFQSMEAIYSACSPLAVYDHVLNGVRRKIDVARMLVEDTRGLMTEEAMRESVNTSMRKLRRELGRRTGR